VLGPQHPDTLTAMGNLGDILYEQGDLPGARRIDEQTLDAARRVLGAEHPNTLIAMRNLAEVLYAQGDLPEDTRVMASSCGKTAKRCP